MNAERQRRYRARLNDDPQKRAEYLMKQRLRKKKDVVMTQSEMKRVISQDETRYVEMEGTGVVGEESVYDAVVSSFHCSCGWT